MRLGRWSMGTVFLLVGSTMCQSPEHEPGKPSRAGAPPGGEAGLGGEAGGAGGSPSGDGGAPEAGMGGLGGSDAGTGAEGGEPTPRDPPTISRERSIPNPVEGEGPARSGHQIALAYGGGVYLVVWDDHSGSGTTIDILGARYDEAGTLLDEQPIVIAGSASDEEAFQVAFDGANFLITWSGFRAAVRAGGVDVLGARWTPARRLLDPEPITILPDGYLHASAPGASGWLVAAKGDAMGLRWIEVDESGSVGEERELIPSGNVFGPVLGAGDASTLVLASVDDTPNGNRLNALLFQDDVLEPVATDLGRSNGYSQVAWGGDAYYFTWLDASYAVALERIDESGARTSLALPDVESVGGVAASEAQVALAYNAYENGSYSGRIRPFTTAPLAAGTELELSTFAENLTVGSVARGSSTFAVVHGSGLTVVDDTLSAVVRRTDPLPSVGVSQREPAVAGDASGFALAWGEVSALAGPVRLVRFDASGELADPTPIEVGSGSGPAAARRDGETLVAWSSGGSLRVSLIDADGVAADTQTVAEYRTAPPFGAYSYNTARVAASEDGFVVSYYEYPPEQGLPNLVTRGLYGATAPLPATPRTTGYGTANALASVDGGFALAYAGLLPQRPALLLELTTEAGVRSVVVEEGTTSSPSLASMGNRVLVAWEAGAVTNGENLESTLHAAVIDVESGERVGEILELASAGEFALGPSAAFDGERFLVTWTQGGPESSYDFVGARIETSGRLYDSVPFSLTAPERRRHAPVLAAGPDAMLCAYTRLVEPSAASSVKLLWLGR